MGRAGRWYAVVLLTAYVAGLAVLVTQPWGWELNRLTVRLWVFFRSDVPIAPDRWGPEHYGVLLNVVLFVPFGFLLAVATGLRWWLVALACVAASMAIEVSQAQWFERVGDPIDVVANGVGALVGALALSLLRRARRAPGPRPG